jgi:tripeptidyl-peptidase-1
MLSTRQFTLTFSYRIVWLIHFRYFTNHDPGIPYYSTLNDTTFPPNPPSGKYNRIGRGYPDISAVGLNYPFFVGENFVGTGRGGTSMATPVVASVFTLINEERLAAGKSTVGFVNPTLYANPQMFNDITVGNQSLSEPCGTNGFSCVLGWDPVTGLGTPKYNEWLEVFMALP